MTIALYLHNVPHQNWRHSQMAKIINIAWWQHTYINFLIPEQQSNLIIQCDMNKQSQIHDHTDSVPHPTTKHNDVQFVSLYYSHEAINT